MGPDPRDLPPSHGGVADLQRSERLLQQAQRLARMGSWTWDAQTQKIEWSETMWLLLGLDASTAPSADLFHSLIHPKDLSSFLETSARIAASGESETMTFRIIRRSDGSLRHMRIDAEAGRGEDGAIREFVGMMLDITEHIEAQEALRESEARWRSVALNPFDFVVLVDRQGVYQWVNHTAPGIQQADLIGKASLYDHTATEHHATVDAALRKAFEEGSPAYYECYSPSLASWFASAVGPLVRDGTTVLASVLARDITEARRAEVELRRRERMLADAQRIARVGSWQWDGSTGKVEWSEEMYRICGVERSTVPSVALYNSLVHPDDLPLLLSTAEKFVRGEPSAPHEYRIRRASDGKICHVLTAGELLRDEHGTPTSFLGTTLDITHQRELEADLAQSRKLEAVGRLAGGIAHDFNNVLTAILGNAELAAGDLPDDDPALSYLEAIRSAARRASGLTRQLLTFARRQVVTPRALAPNALIETISELFHPLLGADIHLSLDLAPDVGHVYMDVGQLEQILMNLAVNARDAMPDGGTLTIETRNVLVSEHNRVRPDLSPGEYVCLVVADTGCGIAPELQLQAFEPFFSTKPAGQGTGLGLSTCYGIVKQSQGCIWLESELERGTRVFVYLPRTDAPSASVPPPRPRDALRGGERVLLVEDDPEVRKLCSRHLRDLGYEVLEAGSGAAALELARSFAGPIHLLVTDVMLPDFRGPEVALLASETRPEAKLLYISGYTEEAGPFGRGAPFLQKPFTGEALGAAVRDALSTGARLAALAPAAPPTRAARRAPP